MGGNMKLLLLLLASISSLFPLVKSSVYYVQPSNQQVNITANTLDYYLQNAEKYFALPEICVCMADISSCIKYCCML